MKSHFLIEIKINQFKCFNYFKAEGFKRVNLIGGKNNVGKTAFMEACYIHTHAQTINSMLTAITSIKFDRESLNSLYGFYDPTQQQKMLDATKSYVVSSNLGNTEYDVVEMDAQKNYHVKLNEKLLVIPARDLIFAPENVSNIRIIDNFGWSNGGINWAYEAIQKHDQENSLNRWVNAFDNTIDSFKVIGNVPRCKTRGEYRDLVEFGDGLRHYISIICGLFACENGYLFIDEIDNGIHYAQLDRLWTLIFELSKQTNCQIFAITHSKEMLESFARVAKKLDEQEISYTTLVKNKQNEIVAVTRDYEMLLDSIEQEREVRGW
jgi:AAA15 family ATPase/GTPase